MALGQQVLPAISWPAQITTFGSAELLSSPKFLELAQQFADISRVTQLGNVLPLHVVSHGSTIGNYQWGMHCPNAGIHIIRGDAGYATSSAAMDYFVFTSAARLTDSTVGASNTSSQSVLLIGDDSAVAELFVVGDDGALTSSGNAPQIGRPVDALYAGAGSRYIFTGHRSGQAYIDWWNGSTWGSTTMTGATTGGSIAKSSGIGQYVLATTNDTTNTNVWISTNGGVSFSAVAHNIAGSMRCNGVAYDEARDRWILHRGNAVYAATNVANPTSWTSLASLSGTPGSGRNKSLVCLPGGLLLLLRPDPSVSALNYLSASSDGVLWTRIAMFSTSREPIFPARLHYADGYLFITGGTSGGDTNASISLYSRRLA